MSDNLVKFDPSRIPATPKRRDGYCQHLYVLVDEQTRMLECEKCKQVIDPFDYMWEWANKDRNLAFQRDILQKDIKRLNTQLSELKREERNAKARVRRLKG